ncbi:Disease resistance RPP13-like protein 4 isoform A [Glycine soja]|uniref:Disease resistance RPP13-like protein 4 isoform A n=1 Tax=Glycine soja TaxID=3848 RepID=A0A445JLF8_GLYSO|nr:Disease resistance RPP13-like protein 4 isoform A [Glycine soja]
MSIRTNPFKAVATLLKHLVRVEKEAKLNDLKSELNKIKDLFLKVKDNEEELLDTLAVVDGYIRNKNIRKLREEEGHFCQKIRNSTRKLLPAADAEAVGSSGQASQDVKLPQRPELNTPLPSSTPQLEKDLQMIKDYYSNLDLFDRRWFSSLLQFPENAVLKRREIIFWSFSLQWGVTGDLGSYFWNAEKRLDSLLESKLFVPHGNGKSPIVSKFKINPLVHHKSLSPLFQNEEEQLCGYYSQIMTSSSSHGSDIGYLNFGPGWMAKMKDLRVLQLGRWMQDSPKHHIEVESEEFLKELSGHKNLSCLSLRGISRIFELPPSIVKIRSLKILDLKACHNLETLPSDISSLRNLVQLNLSQCYLLDKMPKGIENLIWLKVLKGFVLGSSSKTPCRISDIAAKLERLKRLSIRIGSGAVIQGEFESLRKLSKLEHLKISWGVFDTRYIDIQISVPSSLKKLHLEGFPGQNIPEWLKPSKLPQELQLTQLHITGGKLKSLDHDNYRSVEIVYLKYLKHLDVDLEHLRKLFPSLRYVEIKQILNQSYLEWSIN